MGARSENREPDRRKWKISRNIFVAETTKEARERGPEQFTRQMPGIYHEADRPRTRKGAVET